MEAQWQQQQQQLRRGRQSNREAKRKERAVCGCVFFFILSLLPVVGLLLLFHPAAFEAYRLTVHVASLSLSLSPATPSPSVVSRNWSVALSVKNSKWGHRLGWDHAQVMLFYGHEFVAGTFLEKFSMAPEGEEILETGGEAGAAVFSRDVGEWVARAMAKDGEDGGVMELTVSVLRHDGRSRYWTGWDGFICRGLKVGFSSQNQRQVGSLLSGSPYKCT